MTMHQIRTQKIGNSLDEQLDAVASLRG